MASGGREMRLFLACAALMAAVSGASSAESPPVPPVNPKSEDECREYQRQYNEYTKALLQKSRECSARNWKATSSDFIVVAPFCGGVKFTTFKACREDAEKSWCAYSGFGQKYGDCLSKATTAERKPIEDAVKKNEERQAKIRREIEQEQCKADSVFPKLESCNTQKESGSSLDELMK